MAVHRHSWPRRQIQGCAKTATIALLRNATSSLFFSFLCNQECSLSLSLHLWATLSFPYLLSLSPNQFVQQKSTFCSDGRLCAHNHHHVNVMWASDLSLNALCCDHSSIFPSGNLSEGKLKCCKVQTQNPLRGGQLDEIGGRICRFCSLSNSQMWVSCLLGPKNQ